MGALLIESLIFLVSFAFYLTGVSPALDGGDAGEFIASAATLGVPHAPGYPLISLLGKCALELFPFSSASYRMHVLSALIASAILVLLFHLLRELLGEENRWAVLGAVFILATRPLFIEQARVAEVFGLNALFAVAILFCLVRNEILLGSFLFGLGLGNHHTLIILIPLFLISSSRQFFSRDPGFPEENLGPVLFHNNRKPVRPCWDGLRHAGKTILFFLFGLSVYLTLPLRARMTPPVNFGDPETWHRFWAVVTRKEFGMASLHPAALPFRDGAVIWAQTQRFFGRLNAQWGIGGMVLIIVGAVFGWKQPHRRKFVVLALLGWFALGWFFEVYSNLSPFSDIGQWRLERFGLLPLVLLTFFVAMAFERRTSAATLVVVLCAAQAGWGFWKAPSFRNNFVFRDVALSVLRSAPKDARIIIDRVLFDEPTSALLVTTVVEKKRPDIHFFYRPGTLFEPAYGKDVLDLDPYGRAERQVNSEKPLLKKDAFPLRVLAFEKENAPMFAPKLDGFLYAEGVSHDAAPFVLRRPHASDYSSRLISVHVPYFMGKAAIERGDAEAARQWFNSAVQESGSMAWLQSNIGGIYAHLNLLEPTAAAFEQAVKLDPYFYESQYGIGFVYMARREWASAIQSFEKASRIAPRRPEAAYMLGFAYYQSHDDSGTRRAWERYLAIDPRGKMAGTVRETLKQIK